MLGRESLDPLLKIVPVQESLEAGGLRVASGWKGIIQGILRGANRGIGIFPRVATLDIASKAFGYLLVFDAFPCHRWPHGTCAMFAGQIPVNTLCQMLCLADIGVLRRRIPLAKLQISDIQCATHGASGG